MSEYNLRAHWVKLSEREPDRDKEVLAWNIKDGMISTIRFREDGPCRYIVDSGSFIQSDDEVNELQEWEWLELEAQQCGEVFTEVVPARGWTREAFAMMLIMQISLAVCLATDGAIARTPPETRWTFGPGFSPETHPGLFEFLCHRDCEGQIGPELASACADEMEALLPVLDEMAKKQFYTDELPYGDRARRWIAGCRLEAENGEPLEFA